VVAADVLGPVAQGIRRTLAPIPPELEPLVVGKNDLEQLLERFHGGVAAAARHLGITRPKLYRLLRVWASSRHRFARPERQGLAGLRG